MKDFEIPFPFGDVAVTISGDQDTGTGAERHRVRYLTLSIADVMLRTCPGATARTREAFYRAAGLDSTGEFIDYLDKPRAIRPGGR